MRAGREWSIGDFEVRWRCVCGEAPLGRATSLAVDLDLKKSCVPFSSSKAEVVEVLGQPESLVESRSSGRPVAIGTTSTGRTILVVYEEIDEDTAYPATAYDLED